MATSFGTEEITIDTRKVTFVKKHTNKIERLFGVKVSFEALTDVGDDKNKWLVVSGNQDNRHNARRYVQAICNPEQTTALKVDGRPALDDAVLEEVERASNAFIVRTGSRTLQVMGSELAYVLALSQLEHTYQVTADKEVLSEDGLRPGALTPTEVVTGVKDMVMDSEDIPQRGNLVDSDSDLFSSSNISQTDPRYHETSPSGSQAAASPAHTHSAGRERGGAFPRTEFDSSGCAPSPPSPEELSGFSVVRPGKGKKGRAKKGKGDIKPTPTSTTTQRTSFNVSDMLGAEREDGAREPLTEEEEGAEVRMHKEELRNIGLGLGYTAEEIEETWLFFDFSQKVQPGEFLSALDRVRANRVKRQGAGGAEKLCPDDAPLQAGKGPAPGKGKKKVGKNVPKGPGKKTETSGSGSPKKWPQNTVEISPVKNPLPSDNSVFVVGEEGNDSVIFMGRDNGDDSVCIVDPAPVTTSGKRQFPGSPQGNYAEAARKRRDYSDDDDQTLVLKPYSASSNDNHSGRQDHRPDLGQAAEAAAYAFPVAAAATSSQVTTNKDGSTPRFVVIDGSNIAMSHGNGKVYSCRGIQICVEYFVRRGHTVMAWVPRTKTYKNQGPSQKPIANQEILEQLREQGYLSYTPARTLNGKHIVSHDDPFILDLAKVEDAVVVSNDNFREFVDEYAFIIGNRVLSFAFSGDHLLFPKDPLGRFGPTLEEFLHKPPAKPDRKIAAKERSSHSCRPPSAQNTRGHGPGPPNHHPSHASRQTHPQKPAMRGRSQSAPRRNREQSRDSRHPKMRMPPSSSSSSSAPLRHEDVTEQLMATLKVVFPGRENEGKIQQVLDNHSTETDINKLTNYCIAALGL